MHLQKGGWLFQIGKKVTTEFERHHANQIGKHLVADHRQLVFALTLSLLIRNGFTGL